MSTVQMFLVALTAPMAWFAVAAEVGAADPREKLETAIPEAIHLLEAKDDVTFLKNFVAPDELKMLTEKMSIEEFARGFRAINADLLLRVLKLIKDVKPELNADGKKATFTFKEEVKGMKSITFFKVDKYWYIQN